MQKRETQGDDEVAASSKRLPGGLESLLPLLLGLLGFVVAFYVLRIGIPGPDPALKALGCGGLNDGAPTLFTATPQYRLWALLICGQTALWFTLFAPLWAALFGSRERRNRVFQGAVMLKALVLVLFLAWVFFFSGSYKAPFENLDALHPGHDDKLTFFNIVGGVAAVFAIVGIWATQAALKDTEENKSAGEPGKRIGNFLALRSALEFYLLAAGVIIGAATLATGALRQAVIAACPDAARGFMVQDVLGYGLAFSFLLALVYAPAYMRLVSARSALHKTLVPLPGPDPGAAKVSWDAWNKEHKAAGELLQANAGLFGSLAGAISILTPLLGSLVSLLLGKG